MTYTEIGTTDCRSSAGSGSFIAASRKFGQQDQERFAFTSGDWNPIHVDPLYARRTIAGATVVHGVHLLLWALDSFAEHASASVPTRLRVSFDRFVLLGEVVVLSLVQQDLRAIRLRVEVEGIVRCSIDLAFGAHGLDERDLGLSAEIFSPSRDALQWNVAQIAGLNGRVPAAHPSGEMAGLFPQAARWLGEEAITALGATTRLVGMVCPGLHSIFHGLDVALQPDRFGSTGIRFSAGPVRHGLIRMDVAGGGIRGTVTAILRAPPREQPSMAELLGLLPGDLFSGSVAVVAGASRGLGALTAKLLATGGAEVIATWSEGEADAETVAADIRSAGGRCSTMQYRIGETPDALATVPRLPTHGYYFAAPTIAKATSQFFDGARFRSLERFFVEGFWEFAQLLRAMRADVRLFYPSTIYVDQWPKGLAEYAMAKAAGEILCAEMNAQLAPLAVVSARLPRLPTDQTASLYQTELADPVAVLLPLIREVQRS